MKRKIQPQTGESNPFQTLFLFIGCIYVLSFLIPSGTFDRVEGMIIPGSFHILPKVYVNPVSLLFQLPTVVWEKMGKLMITMMLVGGSLKLVADTQAIDLGILKLVERFEKKALLLVPVVMSFTAFFGAFAVFVSTVVAFIPLGLLIAKRLDIDNIFAVALIFLGSFLGLTASPISAMSTAIGQEIAGIPIFSGFFYRLVLSFIITFTGIVYVYRYAVRVQKDKRNSLMHHITLDQLENTGDFMASAFTIKHLAIVFVFITGFVFFAIGSIRWGFDVTHLGSVMILVSLICGVLSGGSLSQAMESFVSGAKNMVLPQLFIVLAMSISMILSEAMVLDSIVYYLSLPLEKLGGAVAAIGMYVVSVVVNLFISSGSGKAMVLIPIMAPLADVIGISRQIVVLAFQFGDGSLLNPTSGTLLACLSCAGVSVKEWFRFVLPLFGLLFFIACIALSVGVFIGWA